MMRIAQIKSLKPATERSILTKASYYQIKDNFYHTNIKDRERKIVKPFNYVIVYYKYQEFSQQSILYDMFSSSYLERCTRCTQEAYSPMRYCCNEDDRLCFHCAYKKCPKCRDYPTRICKRQKSKQEECCKCKATRTSSSYEEFFCEKKSQRFYCFFCLLQQYQKYKLSIPKSQKEQQSTYLQLDENVSAQKNAVLDFLQKYCYVCNQKTYGIGIKLKNDCFVMNSCYNQLKDSVKYSLASKQEKKMYEELELLMNRCCSCQKTIQENEIGSKEEDGIIFCKYCVKDCSLSESMYQPDWNRNKQKHQQSLRRSRVDSKEEMKMDKWSSQKKRQKEKPHLVNAPKYNLYECQLCNEGIAAKIQGQNICFNCYNITFSQPDEFSQFDVHFQSLKLDEMKQKSGKVQMKMIPQKQQARQQNLDANKESIKAEKQQSGRGQELTKPIPKNKQKLSIVQKKKDIEQTSQEKLKDSKVLKEKKQALEPAVEKVLSLQNKTSIHQQFLPLDPISLQLKNIKEKVSQCIKCGYFTSQEDSFKTFIRQNKSEKTLRIIQTTSQLQRNLKENKVLIYCKECYCQLKNNAYQSAQVSKRQENENRIFKSLPKKEKNMERQQLLGAYTDHKKDIDKVRPAQNKLGQFCTACYVRVSSDQFNFSDRICKKCDKRRQQKAKIKRQVGKQCKQCRSPMDELFYKQRTYCDKCLFPMRGLI